MICRAVVIKPGRVHIGAFEDRGCELLRPAFATAVIARLDRATQYSRGGGDRSERARRTGSPAFAEDDSGGLDGYRPSHAFFFTSLMLENTIPSARSLT
jgi:hypothetical protein